MNAAFMSFEQHESGIHAVWPGAGGAGGTEVCFRCVPRPVARREWTTINFLGLSGSTLDGIAAGGMVMSVFRAVWPAETG